MNMLLRQSSRWKIQGRHVCRCCDGEMTCSRGVKALRRRIKRRERQQWKKGGTLLMVVLALGLSACEGKPADATSIVPDAATDTAYPVASTHTFTDADYATLVRDGLPELADASQELIMGLTSFVCDSYDEGWSWDDVWRAEMDYGLLPDTAGGLIGAATAYKCPEYKYLAPAVP